MKWVKDAKEGIVVTGGQGERTALTQLLSPEGVLVDQWGSVYVADCANHRVMRWSEGATLGSLVVGGNGFGRNANQLSCPRSLSFDLDGNLYVADYNNNRIQKFEVNKVG
jgi:sugar lactone lactonase YvrE